MLGIKDMGKIFELTCPECGYEKRVFVGGGLSDCNTETILSSFSEKYRRSLSDLIEKGISRLNIYRDLCKCSECGEFSAAVTVKFFYRGKLRGLRDACSVCGEAPERLEIISSRDIESGILESSCPKCGSDVSIKNSGHWD